MERKWNYKSGKREEQLVACVEILCFVFLFEQIMLSKLYALSGSFSWEEGGTSLLFFKSRLYDRVQCPNSHHTWPPQRVTSCHTRVTSQQHKSSHKMDSKCTVLHSSTSLTSACFCLQLCLKVLAWYACISAHFLTHCMCALCRDTAGQERFKTITTAYYRGAMVSTGCL